MQLEYRILLHILVEKSEHDGYCSESECEYSSESYKLVVPIPDNGDFDAFGTIPLNIWDEYLEQYKKDMDFGGSYYCRVSSEARRHGLGQHELVVSVIECEVVQIVV